MAERALLGGRYELGPAIGSGGFATVFRARDRQANTDVAVKLVPPGLDSARLAGDQRRLHTEASVLTRLSSRHLARVIELGADAQGVWLVTELIDGVPLSVEGSAARSCRTRCCASRAACSRGSPSRTPRASCMPT